MEDTGGVLSKGKTLGDRGMRGEGRPVKTSGRERNVHKQEIVFSLSSKEKRGAIR